MTFGEEMFLGLVVFAFGAFAACLAIIGSMERSWAKKQGR